MWGSWTHPFFENHKEECYTQWAVPPKTLFFFLILIISAMLLNCGGDSVGNADAGSDTDSCALFNTCIDGDAAVSDCASYASESECSAQGASCSWCTFSNLCLSASNASACNSSCAALSLEQCAASDTCKYCEKNGACVDKQTESCGCDSLKNETDCNGNQCSWCSSSRGSDLNAVTFEGCLREDLPCLAPRRVFVTAGSRPGNFGDTPLGPFEEADKICQSEADSAALNGTFKALLSTSNNFVGNRPDFFKSYVPYVRASDNALVADDWSHLTVVGTNGVELHNMIDLTATGSSNNCSGLIPNTVWTGSFYPSGVMNKAAADNDCEDWTSATAYSTEAPEYYQYGLAGSCLQTSGNWLYVFNTIHSCSESRRFYCFEQVD